MNREERSSSDRMPQHTLMIPVGTPNTIMPCAVCKAFKRRCSQECLFLPYFPPQEPQKFTSVQKIFGSINVSNMLLKVFEYQRVDVVNSLVYEANARLRDPVYGCLGEILSLYHRVEALEEELAEIKAELRKYKPPQ